MLLFHVCRADNSIINTIAYSHRWAVPRYCNTVLFLVPLSVTSILF